jgi:hypothetical protein
MLQLDHVVFAARSLQEGRDFLEAAFETALAPGGQHRGFGTHNQLLKLGETCYLELIALDPAQPHPEKQPLFGLASEAVQSALARGPQLLAWVARTIEPTHLAPLLQQNAKLGFGQATLMQREQLQWQITHRADGNAIADLLPTLIDWGTTPHPCTRLPASPVTLDWLQVNTTAEASQWITTHCRDALVQTQANSGTPQLIARFRINQPNHPERYLQMESLI